MQTVAVVGGGFSGLLTALHLLKSDASLRVRLIERSGRFARGRAYATACPDHLLNVRASNMSAFPDDPDHFRRWLASDPNAPGGDADSFVSRGRYGDYLQLQLREALGRTAGASRLLLEQDAVVDLDLRADGRWRLGLQMGRNVAVDAVVLAVGLLPPHPVAGASPELLSSPTYFADPWTVRPDNLPPGDVLLVGTGLTMVDTVLSLAGGGRRVFALSRRGLTPASHAPAEAAPSPVGGLGSPLAALRTLRRHAVRVGWRAAVDSIRPQTQAIWRSWTQAQRNQFLRHARPWWDVHRHRMAPAVAARISVLRETGALLTAAGRIRSLRPEGAGVRLDFTPRGADSPVSRSFGAVINCTGPQGDLGATRDPMLSGLRLDGFVRADPLRLGLDVEERLRAIGADGQPTPGLFAVGPLTRSAFWETIAVPDIRTQAAEAARSVSAWLSGAEEQSRLLAARR